MKSTTLLAPNGKPSNLTPEQYKLVRTPAFKKWFGDWEKSPETSSKVVDDNREPLVVWHGSPSVDINVFDIKKSKRQSSGLKEFGSFFTTNKKVAEIYSKAKLTEEEEKKKLLEMKKLIKARENVRNNSDWFFLTSEIDKLTQPRRIYPIFLNLRKIKTFDAKFGANKEGYYNLEVDAGYKIASGNDALEFLRDGRFGVERVDGIRANNVVELAQKKDGWEDFVSTSFLVFNETPQHIKLADGSNTTFDGNDADIRYEQGGNLPPFKYEIGGF